MPTYRKLHVKATESQDINDMPDDFTRLLWIMLPLGLDSKGRGLDNTAWVKAKVMPLREDVTGAMIEAALKWYASRGMVIRYEVNGRRYFCIDPKSWQYHQGDTSKEANSTYPAPPNLLPTYSRPTPDLLPTSSCTDADADSQEDADAEPSAAPAPENPPAEPEKPVETATGEVYRVYEQNIGALTPMIADAIGADIDEFGGNWCVMAISKAVTAEKRSWNYCRAVLKGWRRDGFNPTGAPPNGNGRNVNGNGGPTLTTNSDGSVYV